MTNISSTVLNTMKAAIFDMDGTLLDTFPSILGCINEVLTEMGAVPFKPEELRPLVGTFIGDIYGGKGVDPDKARLRHRELYMSQYIDTSKAYPGALETLANLRLHKVKTAVVTMRVGHIARAVLEQYGFMNNLDIVLGEDEVARAKPDPEHILAALRKLNVDSVDAFMIGDSEYDMLAGLRAGCRPIGVSWGYGKPANAGKVTIVGTFKELENEIFGPNIRIKQTHKLNE
ncbi:MAG: HAD family hydrolase [Thermoplasmata archaeon]|nr:HAD family hydrolase [Thermoplasmata archaeon]